MSSRWVAAKTSGSLLAQPGEGGDVEEAAVVQFARGDPPPAQPVVLGVQGRGDVVGVGGAGRGRQHVVVVDDDPRALGVLLDGDLPGGQAVREAGAEDRDQHPARIVGGGPVDVEPGGVGGFGALPQHRPPGRVRRLRGDGHVVRDDVDDDPEAGLAARGGQPAQAARPAELGVDLAVLDDVVAVRRAGGGLQHRRQVQVRHAERGQVGDDHGRVGEGEVQVELEPVGRGRDHSLASGAARRRGGRLSRHGAARPSNGRRSRSGHRP